MLKRILGLIFIIALLWSCSSNTSQKKSKKKEKPEYNEVVVNHDLEDIKKEGVLNVLTTYSSTSYFLYKGQPMGYEYELLKRFAEHLGVELKLVISNNIDSMYRELTTGEVDLIAHGLTITSKRKELVHFSEHLYLTHQVLVQKKPDNWRNMKWSELQRSLVHDVIDLIGDTVSVRDHSSYINRLSNLSDEIGGKIHIDTLPRDLSTDRVIEMVASGKVKYTVADNNIASINASYYPGLNIDVPVSFSQRISWALRPNSTELENALNDWIRKMKKETVYYVIYNKYFKNAKNFRRRERSEFYSLNNNKISQYDELIKTYAKPLGWDWRLLASQVYQESHFNPSSSSWAGANGLLQLMPKTAESLGVTDTSDPEQSMMGGTKFLRILWNRFEDIPDSVQRIKFCMASYNCGYSHVKDAQYLAETEGFKSDVWDGNVEEMILKLSYRENYTKSGIKYGYVRGIEPFTYIRQIFTRYDHYRQYIK
ncbi:MAG: transporter substrate-binding domain-containing protein [Bacteroidota bacterium]